MGVNCFCFDTLRTEEGQIPENIFSSRPTICRRIVFLHSQFQKDGTDKENKVLCYEECSFLNSFFKLFVFQTDHVSLTSADSYRSDFYCFAKGCFALKFPLFYHIFLVHLYLIEVISMLVISLLLIARVTEFSPGM